MTEAQKALNIVKKELSIRRKELEDFLTFGNAKTFDEYKELCGKINGLTSAELEINDLLSKLEQNDDF